MAVLRGPARFSSALFGIDIPSRRHAASRRPSSREERVTSAATDGPTPVRRCLSPLANAAVAASRTARRKWVPALSALGLHKKRGRLALDRRTLRRGLHRPGPLRHRAQGVGLAKANYDRLRRHDVVTATPISGLQDQT